MREPYGKAVAPQTGPEPWRCVRKDPYAGSIYSPDTLNGYGYCGGDPINYIDPSGMVSFHLLGELMDMAGDGIIEMGIETMAIGATIGASAGGGGWTQLGIGVFTYGVAYKGVGHIVQIRSLASNTGPYRGGSHGDMTDLNLYRGDGLQSHHMPDRGADLAVSALDGPAIQMGPFDHRATSSWGSGRLASQYRDETANMISRGQYRDAMPAKAIHSCSALYICSQAGFVALFLAFILILTVLSPSTGG